MEQTKNQVDLFHFLSLARLLFSSSVSATNCPGSSVVSPVGFLLASFFFFFKIYLFYFIYFIFGCVGSFLLHAGFSLVAASGGYSLLQCAGFSLQWLLLLWSTGSRHVGFSRCGMQAQQLWLLGSRAQAQQLWHMGLVALRHVGSSWTRGRTGAPCIGRQILNHCAPGKPSPSIFIWASR